LGRKKTLEKKEPQNLEKERTWKKFGKKKELGKNLGKRIR